MTMTITRVLMHSPLEGDHVFTISTAASRLGRAANNTNGSRVRRPECPDV